MDSTVNFYVIRHGETLLNFLHKAQGWVDSPLTKEGIQTASTLGQQLQHIYFSAAYSSDTSRAMITGKTILTAKGQKDLPLVSDERLREWCLGCWEAVDNDVFTSNIMNSLPVRYTFSELNLHLPDVCAFIYKTDTTGMAEPFETITNRLENFFREIGDYYLPLINPNILIVTHAFTIKTLLYQFSKETLEKTSKIQNADVIHITWNGKSLSVFTDV